MVIADFKEIKDRLKNNKWSVAEVAEITGWSRRTVGRVKKARSFKQYREICQAI